MGPCRIGASNRREFERGTVQGNLVAHFSAVQLKFESADLMAAVASHHVRSREGVSAVGATVTGDPGTGNGNHEHAKEPVSCCEH